MKYKLIQTHAKIITKDQHKLLMQNNLNKYLALADAGFETFHCIRFARFKFYVDDVEDGRMIQCFHDGRFVLAADILVMTRYNGPVLTKILQIII